MLSEHFQAILLFQTPADDLNSRHVAGKATDRVCWLGFMIQKLLLQLLCASLFASSICAVERVTVARVIDGDTIETSLGTKVRLVGINAPEIQDLYGQESKEHLRFMIEGKVVDLVPDNISSDRDRYDRLLRYIMLDGTDVNRRMVEDGFAFAYLKFRFSKSREYITAEKQAKALAVGVWSRQDIQSVATPQEQRATTTRHSLRVYIIAGLVLLLIALGVYFYVRR